MSVDSACVRILWKLRQQRGSKMVLAYLINILVKMNMFRTRWVLFYFAKTIGFVSWGNISPFSSTFFWGLFSSPFSSRFFNTNVLFLYTLYSSFFFWCLVQSGLFLFLKLAFLCYSSTALAGGYSCVTLTLTLSAVQPFLLQQVNNHLVHDFLSQQNNRLFLFLSELMDLFVAGWDPSAANQPNNLAEGPPPLVTIISYQNFPHCELATPALLPTSSFLHKHWTQVQRCILFGL